MMDLKAVVRVEAAWKRYEQGKFKSMPFDKFLREFDTW